MENELDFIETSYFSCKGEKLLLSEIMKTKKIVFVKISYLLKGPELKKKSLKRFFKLKKITLEQEEKELTISDDRGISLEIFPENELAMIRFWEEKEFVKLDQQNYDADTIFRRYIFSLVAPYKIFFHRRNLQEIKWVAKN